MSDEKLERTKIATATRAGLEASSYVSFSTYSPSITVCIDISGSNDYEGEFYFSFGNCYGYAYGGTLGQTVCRSFGCSGGCLGESSNWVYFDLSGHYYGWWDWQYHWDWNWHINQIRIYYGDLQFNTGGLWCDSYCGTTAYVQNSYDYTTSL
ncbi:uncharacterized protein LOC142341091 [Convolutriloba macropyga]|uniref:uncharacterized protein LOC142341091 n=1 Tax=Convolutriloba macropyga TaxID=536237 RepID=UPI003F523614